MPDVCSGSSTARWWRGHHGIKHCRPIGGSRCMAVTITRLGLGRIALVGHTPPALTLIMLVVATVRQLSLLAVMALRVACSVLWTPLWWTLALTPPVTLLMVI